MPQLNKTPSGATSSRLQALQDDLVADRQAQEEEIASGHVKVREHSAWQDSQRRAFRGFAIKQGRRRRHPDHVLNQFRGAKQGLEKADSVWEEALEDEEDRVTLDKRYKAGKETTLLTAQFGLHAVADQNFSRGRHKLDQIALVGI